MNQGRVLYHLVVADFLERVRRYNFLVTLAAAVYLGYACYAGKVVIRLDEYRGVYNSAWLGCLMTLIATVFLSLIGFYIVKNSIQRDEETRVGQILATTPMTKTFYTLAKTISNFAVLAAMVAVMAVAAVAMQWMKGEVAHIDWWQLLSPFVLFALPAMAFTGALAVLFETLPVLRSGMGNVIYFFVWTALLSAPIGILDKAGPVNREAYFADFTGIVSVMGQMQQDLRRIDPGYKNGTALTIGDTQTSKKFLWNGLSGNSALYLSRVTCVLAALAIALLAAVFFHRFDPAREWVPRKRPAEVAANGERAIVATTSAAPSERHLTPLVRGPERGSFPRVVAAELRLMLKGHRWWWYVVAAGLFVASLFAPLSATHQGIAIVAAIWPVLVWSQMGTREKRWETSALIFSSERALWRQLPAVWLAGVIVAAITNGGLGIRLAVASDLSGLAAWTACILFIPSLALALGIWSGTSKTFEGVYTAWWYLGVANHLPGLDFLGTTSESVRPALYLGLAVLLVVAAFFGRRTQMAYA